MKALIAATMLLMAAITAFAVVFSAPPEKPYGRPMVELEISEPRANRAGRLARGETARPQRAEKRAEPRRRSRAQTGLSAAAGVVASQPPVPEAAAKAPSGEGGEAAHPTVQTPKMLDNIEIVTGGVTISVTPDGAGGGGITPPTPVPAAPERR